MHTRGDLPSGTVTFLFTDVEGSTKLLHELGAEAYDQALVEHRRVLREAFVRHGGVEVDTQGDAFFYAFPTAEGALDAAGEATAALEAGPDRRASGPAHGRRPTSARRATSATTSTWRRASQLPAHGGQVVALRGDARSWSTLELTDLGEHRLKDIAEAVPIYQLGERLASRR